VGKAGLLHGTSSRKDTRKFHFWRLLMGGGITVGAMVLTTIALVCAIVALVRGSRNLIYIIALIAAWVVGFFDALHHARDAWAVMPAALALSAIATLFALVATWAGLSGLRVGGAR
ncbi:hypothetical protein, partial [Xanthomonas phaseoli]|uniref:hypothetical protein n=1 Tax=Xanthomonas phaseoli TaxID=1985254 RepID=UPI001ED93AD7